MDDAATNTTRDRTLFLWLLSIGLFGALIGVPWAVAVAGDTAVAWIEAGSSVIFLIPACAAGVWLGPKVGLGSRLRGLVTRSTGAWDAVRTGLGPGTLVGLAIGGVVFLGVSSMPEDALIPGSDNPTIFEFFLRSLSAGLTEEIAFRFGLMTFFVWLLRSGLKRKVTHTTAVWVGNLLAALLFGAAHLPGLPAEALVPALLVPIVTVNTAAGMIMGWLFVRWGLASAIVANFVADVAQSVVPRLVALIG
jgi:hypothetical protein